MENMFGMLALVSASIVLREAAEEGCRAVPKILELVGIPLWLFKTTSVYASNPVVHAIDAELLWTQPDDRTQLLVESVERAVFSSLISDP